MEFSSDYYSLWNLSVLYEKETCFDPWPWEFPMVWLPLPTKKDGGGCLLSLASTTLCTVQVVARNWMEDQQEPVFICGSIPLATVAFLTPNLGCVCLGVSYSPCSHSSKESSSKHISTTVRTNHKKTLTFTFLCSMSSINIVQSEVSFLRSSLRHRRIGWALHDLNAHTYMSGKQAHVMCKYVMLI